MDANPNGLTRWDPAVIAGLDHQGTSEGEVVGEQTVLAANDAVEFASVSEGAGTDSLLEIGEGIRALGPATQDTIQACGTVAHKGQGMHGDNDSAFSAALLR